MNNTDKQTFDTVTTMYRITHEPFIVIPIREVGLDFVKVYSLRYCSKSGANRSIKKDMNFNAIIKKMNKDNYYCSFDNMADCNFISLTAIANDSDTHDFLRWKEIDFSNIINFESE